MTEPEPGDHQSSRDEVKSQALRGVKWAVLDKWGSRVFAFVSFALLAYLLSPEAFGVVAAAQVIIALAQTLTEQGIGPTVIVQKRDDIVTRSTAFWMSVVAGVIGAAILWLTAPLVANIMGSPQLVAVLPVLSAYFVIRGLGVVPEALLQRRLQFRGLAIRTLVATIVSGAIAVVLALVGAGVWALVVQILVQVTMSTVMVWVAARFRPSFRVDLREARNVLTFSWKVLLVNLLTVGVVQGDKFVVGALLGPVALGYYTVAYRLLSVLVDAFTGIMSTMSTPVFARLRDDREYTARTLSRVTGLSLACTVPVFGSLFVLAPVLVPIIFGQQWQLSVPILQALCVGGVLSSVTYFDRGVLYAAGRPGLEIIGVAVLASGTVIAAVIGAQFGVVAVAIAVTIRMFVTLPVRMLLLRTAIGINLRKYIWAWRGPITGALALTLAAAVVLALTGGLPLFAQCVIAAAAGLVGYALALLFVDRTVVSSGWQIVRSRRSR